MPISHNIKLHQRVLTPLSKAPYVVIELHPEEHRITVMSIFRKRPLKIAEHKVKPFVEKHSFGVEVEKRSNKNKNKNKNNNKNRKKRRKK